MSVVLEFRKYNPLHTRYLILDMYLCCATPTTYLGNYSASFILNDFPPLYTFSIGISRQSKLRSYNWITSIQSLSSCKTISARLTNSSKKYILHAKKGSRSSHCRNSV